MNESQRRTWLGTLLDSQLQALLSMHGFPPRKGAPRESMITTLVKVEGIEIPRETT